MIWEAALRRRLLADGALSAQVADRVFWRLRQQGSALPALVLTMISDPRPQTLKAFQGNRSALVQIDCWADGGKDGEENSRAEVAALREAAIAALAGPFVQDGMQFSRSTFDPVRDLGEATETGFVHRDSFDATVWHS